MKPHILFLKGWWPLVWRHAWDSPVSSKERGKVLWNQARADWRWGVCLDVRYSFFCSLAGAESVDLWGPWQQFSVSVSLVALSLPTLSRAQLCCIRGTCYPHQQNRWYNVDCLWRSTSHRRWNCGWVWGSCEARAAETRVLMVCSSSWFVWSGSPFPGSTFDDSVLKFHTSPCIFLPTLLITVLTLPLTR